MIVISAKNTERLRAYVQEMLAHLEKVETRLVDFAYTLQVGRDAMPDRLALVASTLDEVREKFRTFLASGSRVADVLHNHIGKIDGKPRNVLQGSREDLDIRSLAETRQFYRLAELWVSGQDIDWRLLHPPGVADRISLPSYPFARERY